MFVKPGAHQAAGLCFTALALGHPGSPAALWCKGEIWPLDRGGHILYGGGADAASPLPAMTLQRSPIVTGPSEDPTPQAKKLKFLEVSTEAQGPTAAKEPNLSLYLCQPRFPDLNGAHVQTPSPVLKTFPPAAIGRDPGHLIKVLSSWISNPLPSPHSTPGLCSL